MKTALSFEEYTRLSHLFVHHIRRREMAEAEWGGISEKRLLEWYLDTSNELGLFVGEDEALSALEVAKFLFCVYCVSRVF